MAEWPSREMAARLVAPAFTEEDFNSNDGMQTAIFGPIFWASIHLVSFNYPVHPTPADRERHRRWLLATGDVLPCRYCRENFASNVERAGGFDDAFESRDALSRFCHRLHAEVSRMLGKEGPPVSYEQLREQYEGFRSRCVVGADRVGAERGCTVPKHEGAKGRCVLKVIPREATCEGFEVDEACRVRVRRPFETR